MTIEQIQQSVDGYLKFMWNRFDRDRCGLIFESTNYDADHIWKIWTTCVASHGYIGAPAEFWAMVDKHVQKIVLDAAADWARLREL